MEEIMKKLILLRHAKTEKDNEMKDIDRHIIEEGKASLKKTGIFFKNLAIIPELIICSVAKRAKETLEIFLETTGINTKIKFEKLIYENDEKTIIELIRGTDNKINNLMLIGHNPSFENIVSIISEDNLPEEGFKTSGIVIINFNSESWKDIAKNKGILQLYMAPEKIK
jgi:phosphohistidine phosphatase